LRESLAEQEDVATHVILSDVALTEISQFTDSIELEALKKISGVGQHKLEAYGEAIVALVNKHTSARSSGKLSETGGFPKLLAKGPAPTDAQSHTWNLYKKGMTAQEIAAQQGLPEKNIINHFIALVRAAMQVDVSKIIPDFDQVMEELDNADPYASLSEVKADLSVDLSNEEFRLVLAWREGIGVS